VAQKESAMNKHDRDNLRFLLTIDEQSFQDFLEQSNDDDIDYAIELIQTHRAELMVRQLAMEELVDQEMGLDLSDAQLILTRFRL
jgi:hypothetical protein